MKGFSSLSARAKPFIPATSSLADVDLCFLSPVVTPRSSSPFQSQGLTVTNGIPAKYYTDPETQFISDYFSSDPTTVVPSPLPNLQKLGIPTKNSISKTPSVDHDSLIDSPCYEGTDSQFQFDQFENFQLISHVGETSAPPIVTVEKLNKDKKGLGSNMKKEVFIEAVHGLSDMLVDTCPNDELPAGEYMKLQIVIQNLEKLLEKSRKGKSGTGIEDENKHYNSTSDIISQRKGQIKLC